MEGQGGGDLTTFAHQLWTEGKTRRTTNEMRTEGGTTVDVTTKKCDSRIRVSKKTIIGGMSQGKVEVTTAIPRLIVIKPLVSDKTNLRVANGVADGQVNQPFWLFE